MFARRQLTSMGTTVELVLDRDPDPACELAFDEAEVELARLAGIFTRFDPTSELRLLEHHRARQCGPELLEVLELALDGRRRSGGLFDPSVLPALRAAGYDRTFADVRARPVVDGGPRPCGGTVAVDHETGIVALGTGTCLDLGGVAKGWIADRIADQLAAVAPALVDAGGDIACTPRRDGRPWSIDVSGHDGRLELTSGGIATSGRDRRRWREAGTGAELHHVIDPRTGRSACTDLMRVTVVAPSCAEAELAATSILVAGSDSATAVAAHFATWFLALDTGDTTTRPELTPC